VDADTGAITSCPSSNETATVNLEPITACGSVLLR